jgi:class 3 adenylate cyclase
MRMAAFAEYAALVLTAGITVFVILKFARTKLQLSVDRVFRRPCERSTHELNPTLTSAQYREGISGPRWLFPEHLEDSSIQSSILRTEAIGAPSASPVFRALFVVDIENSTANSDLVKGRLRRTLYHLLDEALRLSEISPEDRDRLVDRGDGVLVLIKPTDRVPTPNLFTVLVPKFERLVAQHNNNSPELVLRLRMAVHAGEVHHDEHGPFGEAVDLTCRLLDSSELKTALKCTDAPTVLAVSQYLYEAIIRHDYDDIDATRYSPFIRIELVGKTREGWLRTDLSTRHPDITDLLSTKCPKQRPRTAAYWF